MSLQSYCVSLLRRSVSTRRNARGKVWGTDEINVEGWKPLKRLQGHSSGSFAQLSKSCCTHTFLRCHRRCMVTRRPIPCFSWPRLSSYGLVWLYTWYISLASPIYLLLHSLTHLDQNVYASLTYIKASSRVCAGILLENSLPLSRMIGV